MPRLNGADRGVGIDSEIGRIMGALMLTLLLQLSSKIETKIAERRLDKKDLIIC